MIYLDANIFLYPLTSEDEKSEKCKRIISEVVENNNLGCTSMLTWDEVIYTLMKEKGKEEAAIEARKFLTIPNLIFIDVNFRIISFAQSLVENYSLKPRDAIHAATAILNNCKEIASDDPDFDKIKELKRRKI
ncbi:MAG: type II toxin-antitoxin system VapC family toxin [Nanoarchaeota archaeon]